MKPRRLHSATTLSIVTTSVSLTSWMLLEPCKGMGRSARRSSCPKKTGFDISLLTSVNDCVYMLEDGSEEWGGTDTARGETAAPGRAGACSSAATHTSPVARVGTSRSRVGGLRGGEPGLPFSDCHAVASGLRESHRPRAGLAKAQ